MPDPISAVVGVASVASGAAGGIGQRNAAKSAGRAGATATGIQSASIEDALAQSKEQYGINRGYIQPYYDQGLKGQTALNYGMGFGTDSGGNANISSGQFVRPFSQSDFEVDPGYQFTLSEGQKALDRQASAKSAFKSFVIISQFCKSCSFINYHPYLPEREPQPRSI